MKKQKSRAYLASSITMNLSKATKLMWPAKTLFIDKGGYKVAEYMTDDEMKQSYLYLRQRAKERHK